MRCSQKRTKSQDALNSRGWVLIDSLFAIVILSVGIAAVLGAFTQTSKSASFSDKATQAAYLAQQGLERLKYYDGKTVAPTIPASTTSGIFTISFEHDTATKALSPASDLNITPVKVTVNWTDPAFNNATRSISLSSYYFFYDD